ncbi:MAG: hypothetical protein CL561_02060 [Alphaproteobacteria bacterium]|nr:hypothetical protein [Alphaproteobacteria bacterium]
MLHTHISTLFSNNINATIESRRKQDKLTLYVSWQGVYKPDNKKTQLKPGFENASISCSN